KGDFAVQELNQQYFAGLMDCAIGEKEGVRKKPAPDSVNEVLKKLQIERENAVYIGDSEVDIETAENAGMDCIIVSWGFREREFLAKRGAKTIVDSAQELRNHILGM
ncbi:HAD-IA family hydrolase, partial [Parabacteroides distasonis]